jgi:hypothetical protein
MYLIALILDFDKISIILKIVNIRLYYKDQLLLFFNS